MALPTQLQNYRPEIDGLRAIAVLSVIFFHAGFTIAPGGFVGVDIFFVISGFLITGIILKEMEQSRFTLTSFYARRARRILPALMFVSLVTTVGVVMSMSPAQQIDFFDLLTAAALFHSNFVLSGSTGYFDGPAELRPLLHTWSLGIEEQYYFLFPLLVMVCWRFGRRKLLLLLVLIALSSIVLSEFGWRHHRQANFFFTPSRVWELLLGSIAAFATPGTMRVSSALRQHRLDAIAGTGLVAIGASIATMTHLTPTPSAYMLVPTLGTAAVLLTAVPGTRTARLLSIKPLVGIGVISYSAYLWHQPLLSLAKVRSITPLSSSILLVLIGVTLFFAFISWKFVEQPFRKTRSMPDKKWLLLALPCTIALALIGVIGKLSAADIPPTVPVSVLKSFGQPARSKECFDIPYAHNKAEGWLCSINQKRGGAPDFALFGDSHALQLLSTFEKVAIQNGRHGVFAGFSGCAPLLGVYPLTRPDQASQDCHALNQRMLAYVHTNKIKDIYLVAKWSYYTHIWNGTNYLNAIGLSKADTISVENSRKAFQQGFKNTVRAYAAIGATLHVIEQAPQQAYAPAAVYERVWKSPQSVDQALMKLSISRTDHRNLQAFPASIFRKYMPPTNVRIVNFDDVFCDFSVCPMGIGTQSFYQDQSHLSEDGAQRMIPLLAQSLPSLR